MTRDKNVVESLKTKLGQVICLIEIDSITQEYIKDFNKAYDRYNEEYFSLLNFESPLHSHMLTQYAKDVEKAYSKVLDRNGLQHESVLY